MPPINLVENSHSSTEPLLSATELERYSRQLQSEGFGGQKAQARLRSTSVAVSRCGGVGGTCAMLLARAGIGKLVLAHGGRIVRENLNRMHLAYTEDLNRPYTEAFEEKLRSINPDVELTSIADNIGEENVDEFVSGADIVADGAPLFEERYAMNGEAVRRRKPLVSGAMYDLEGYVTTIVPQETPCLACIYPVRPDYWVDAHVFPVIGPISTIVGAVMAMEVIKLVTGTGETLKGLLWRIDLQENTSRQFTVKRREDCEVCGSKASQLSIRA